MPSWKPDIFEYLDYREYLKDYYEAGKREVNAFSYRYLSRLAGFSSPNFFKLVMDGDRNVGRGSIDKFAAALRLDAEETRFFADLVAFNQAETDDERNQAFERLSASRRFKQARRIDRSMFDYLSHWYHPVIREMVARPDFREDPAWIAEQLFPPVDVSQVADSLDLLEELELLTRDEDGELQRGQPALTTGHEVRSLAIANYHREMIERAGACIEQVDSELRDISAMTACISVDRVAELKQRIQSFRERLLDLVERDESPEVVYQLNIQLFPLSRPIDDET